MLPNSVSLGAAASLLATFFGGIWHTVTQASSAAEVALGVCSRLATPSGYTGLQVGSLTALVSLTFFAGALIGRLTVAPQVREIQGLCPACSCRGREPRIAPAEARSAPVEPSPAAPSSPRRSSLKHRSVSASALANDQVYSSWQ